MKMIKQIVILYYEIFGKEQSQIMRTTEFWGRSSSKPQKICM